MRLGRGVGWVGGRETLHPPRILKPSGSQVRPGNGEGFPARASRCAASLEEERQRCGVLKADFRWW